MDLQGLDLKVQLQLIVSGKTGVSSTLVRLCPRSRLASEGANAAGEISWQKQIMFVVWSHPELSVLLVKAMLVETMETQWKQCLGKATRFIDPTSPKKRQNFPTPLTMNSLLTQNNSATGLAPSCWAAAWCCCRQSLGERKG